MDKRKRVRNPSITWMPREGKNGKQVDYYLKTGLSHWFEKRRNKKNLEGRGREKIKARLSGSREKGWKLREKRGSTFSSNPESVPAQGRW